MKFVSQSQIKKHAMLHYRYCSSYNKSICHTKNRRLYRSSPGILQTCVTRVLPLSTAAANADDDGDVKENRVQEEDDWGTAWSDSGQDGGLFKRDGPFAVFLIIISTVVSTIVFQMGLRRIKNVSRISKSHHALSRSSSVYAPVVPKEETAQQYKTGWPDDDIPDHWSSTVDDGNKLPLRTPDGNNDLDMALAAQRQQYERLKEQVDGQSSSVGRENERGGEGYYDWDAIFSDDEAPYSGITFSEMKDRARKASKAATRAAGYAHQASVAASIATKATNDAQSAAHKAIEAALKSERALERKSGQIIVEAYNAARKAENEAEKNARLAAEMAAKSLMDEKSGTKSSREAIACEDLTRPHGFLNKSKAIWYAVSTGASNLASTIMKAGSFVVAACHDVSVKVVAHAKNFPGLVKQQLPNSKVSS